MNTTKSKNGNGKAKMMTAAIQNLDTLIQQIEAIEGTLSAEVAHTGKLIEEAVGDVLRLYAVEDTPDVRAAIRAALLWDFEREAV